MHGSQWRVGTRTIRSAHSYGLPSDIVQPITTSLVTGHFDPSRASNLYFWLRCWGRPCSSLINSSGCCDSHLRTCYSTLALYIIRDVLAQRVRGSRFRTRAARDSIAMWFYVITSAKSEGFSLRARLPRLDVRLWVLRYHFLVFVFVPSVQIQYWNLTI